MRKAAMAGLLLTLVAGCAGVAHLMSDAEIRPVGNALFLSLSTSLPSGVYTLESASGKVLAKGVTDPRRGVAVNGRVPLNMSVDLRLLQGPRECLRVRRPDGQMLSIGTPGKTQFQLPALEAAYLQSIEIPELGVAERAYPRNVQVVAEARRWIASNPPELTPTQQCRVPLPSFGSCSTAGMAREAARDSCMASVVTCNSAGLAADLASKWSDRNKGASSLAGLFTSNLCSAAFDLSRGDRVNLLSMFRDTLIDLSAQALLRSLTNDNPTMEQQVLMTAAVTAIHYENCLGDAVDQCRQQNARQQRFSQQLYSQCTARLTLFRRADYFLETYRSPAEIRTTLQERQARLRELQATGMLQRTPLVHQVLPCS